MSARQCFAFCLDCWELNYGVTDSNGVFTRDSGSSNHWDHAVHTFGDPDDYASPIRGVLQSLHRGHPISDARMEMFSLALALTAIQPNNGIKPDTDRAQAAPSYVAGHNPPGALPRQAMRPESVETNDEGLFEVTP